MTLQTHKQTKPAKSTNGNGTEPHAMVFKIEKPNIAIAHFDVTISGDRLLVDRMSEDAIAKIGTYGETGTEKGEIQALPKTPEAVAERGRYLCDDGSDGFPSSGLRAMIRDAAVTIPELSKASINRSLIVLGDILPLTFRERRLSTKVGRNSGPRPTPRLVHRTEYLDWGLVFRVRLILNELNPSQLYALLHMGGLSIGIGNWRPGCGRGGSHGTFEIKNFEAVQQ